MSTARTSTKPFTDLEREVVAQLVGLRAMADLGQDEMGLSRGTYGDIERLARHADVAALGSAVAAIVATGRTDLRDLADLIGRAEAALRYRTDPGLSLR